MKRFFETAGRTSGQTRIEIRSADRTFDPLTKRMEILLVDDEEDKVLERLVVTLEELKELLS